MQMRVVVDCLICRSASGSYMSISSHCRLNGSTALAMRRHASVLKLKFRSRQISTSGPTAPRKVPMSVLDGANQSVS